MTKPITSHLCNRRKTISQIRIRKIVKMRINDISKVVIAEDQDARRSTVNAISKESCAQTYVNVKVVRTANLKKKL